MKNKLHPIALVSNLLLSGVFSASAQTTITASEDHTVRRNEGTATVEINLHVKQSNANTTDRFIMLRFDSEELGADVSNATFLISANPDSTLQFQGSYDFEVFGVLDGDAQDEKFMEGAANYLPNADGALFDGSLDMIDESQVVSLGTFNASAGTQVSLSTPELVSFLQADTNGTATLVVIRQTNIGGNSTFLDQGTATPPRLEFDSSSTGPNGFTITQFIYDPVSQDADVTFTSTPGNTYMIETSTDGENWNELAGTTIQGAEGVNTTTLSEVALPQNPAPSTLLLRVKLLIPSP